MRLKEWKSIKENLIQEIHFSAFFRIGISLLSIIYILNIWSDFDMVFAGELIPLDIMQAISTNMDNILAPVMNFFYELLGVKLFYDLLLAIYLIGLVSLLLGLLTRLSAFIVLLTHILIFYGAELFQYGFDQFILQGLIFCLVFPVGNYMSLDVILLKNKKKQFFIFKKILRITLYVVYFFSGLSKAIDGIGWWNGEKMLAALHFNTTEQSLKIIDFLSEFPTLLIAGGIATLLIELFYPLLMNLKVSRDFCLVSIVLMHLMIGFFLSLYSFALIMIIWNISAFYDFSEVKNYFYSTKE